LRAVDALVLADGLAVDASQAVDLALTLATLEQRGNGRLQMQLQDVHSPCPSFLRRSDDNVLPLLISGAEDGAYAVTLPLGGGGI